MVVYIRNPKKMFSFPFPVITPFASFSLPIALARPASAALTRNSLALPLGGRRVVAPPFSVASAVGSCRCTLSLRTRPSVSGLLGSSFHEWLLSSVYIF